MTERKGRCLCGAVKFKAAPKKNVVDACHCGVCRRFVGGPLMTLECGDTVKFEDESALGVYASSDWAERGFCKTCGTSLFWRLKDRSLYTVHAGTFDDLSGVTFETEIFIEEKPEFYDFAQKTKKMTGKEVFDFFNKAQEQS